MAVIFSYPIKSTPDNDDLILISDGTDKLTKQVRVSSLPGGSSAGVSSLNTLTGAVTITGGTNVTLNTVGNNIEINAASGSGSSYQAGNGIDINTGTNPDTISTGLLANGGIVFSSNKMQVDLAATAMSGELRAIDGGTGFSTYAVGDLLYAETTSTLAQLNIGASNKILGVNNSGYYTSMDN